MENATELSSFYAVIHLRCIVYHVQGNINWFGALRNESQLVYFTRGKRVDASTQPPVTFAFLPVFE